MQAVIDFEPDSEWRREVVSAVDRAMEYATKYDCVCGHRTCPRHSFLYVIEAPSLRLFKIGRSMNPRDRTAAVVGACPVLARLLAIGAAGTGEAERELHVLFRKFRARGEWFALQPTHVSELLRAMNGGLS